MTCQKVYEKEIHSIVQHVKGLHDQAVAVYTPLVDDICSIIAPMNEVECCWIICSVSLEISVCFHYTRESVAIIGEYIRKW